MFFNWLFSIYQYYMGKKFRSLGKHTILSRSLKIQGGTNINLGDNTRIGKSCWLAAMPLTKSHTECRLTIGNGCQIGDFNHIFATGSIIIEDEVLTANGVYIADNQHEYSDVHASIIHQPIRQLRSVVIGRGCWIGEHVAIIGASVGKNSVIGANSVVTHDIPDYCVAVGAPARVIKRYNCVSCTWEKVSS